MMCSNSTFPDFSTVSQSEFELPIINNGKQVFGCPMKSYFEFNNPAKLSSTLALQTQENGILYISVEFETYCKIQKKRESLELSINEHIYLWLEFDNGENIINWKLFKLPFSLDYFYPIYQSCYQFNWLYKLIEISNLITIPALKKMFWRVLDDQDLMKKFVSIPASKRHHHSFPSGLLAHTLECIEIVVKNLSLMDNFSQSEKEVAILATLFHDLGKTETLTENQHTNIGQLLNHEQFTLFILSRPLRLLAEEWQQGADTLKYLLSWTPKLGFCRFISGNIIKFADHLSTSYSLNKMAFNGKPSFYHYSSIKVGNSNHFVNRLL